MILLHAPERLSQIRLAAPDREVERPLRAARIDPLNQRTRARGIMADANARTAARRNVTANAVKQSRTGTGQLHVPTAHESAQYSAVHFRPPMRATHGGENDQS